MKGTLLMDAERGTVRSAPPGARRPAAPTADGRRTEAPRTETPRADAPRTEAPRADAPRADPPHPGTRRPPARLPRSRRPLADPPTAETTSPWILMYHSVAVEKEDPYRLTVSPERFAEQIAWLHRRGKRGVSVRELMRARAAGRADRLVGLSFDDGYADFARHAVPIPVSYTHL